MFRRILVGTDFTPTSDAALDQALDLAKCSGGEIVVLHAIEPLDPGEDQDPYATFYETLQRSAEEKMRPLMGRADSRGVPAQNRVVIGKRWQEILRVAVAEKFDLIVIGGTTPGPGGPPMGSTTQMVFLGSPLPLLIARRAGN